MLKRRLSLHALELLRVTVLHRLARPIGRGLQLLLVPLLLLDRVVLASAGIDLDRGFCETRRRAGSGCGGRRERRGERQLLRAPKRGSDAY